MSVSEEVVEVGEQVKSEVFVPGQAQLSSKTAFVKPNDEQRVDLINYVKLRLDEGKGETVLLVGCEGIEEPGLSEDELTASLATIESICKECGLVGTELRRQKLKASNEFVSYMLLRKDLDDEDFLEVRVAVVGNVDAGKSTLLGVLTHFQLDNGRGSARLKLFRHKHEIESGRTSSVGNDIAGFDVKGNPIVPPEHGHMDWAKMCRQAAKVVTFIDLAGHERYLKTTVFGMTGHRPDFTMLMVGANVGASLLTGMTKEHLSLALALSVPVFVVITKIDMTPPNVLAETQKYLQKLLKSKGCRKMPMPMNTEDDVIVAAVNFTSERMCPVFQISSVTGHNVDLVKKFLNLLSTRVVSTPEEPAEFAIDETFLVQGVGTIASGICMQGTIKLGDTLLLGPDKLGEFQPVVIKGVHRKRLPVTEVKAGQTASFALKKVKRNQLRKGMVMCAASLKPRATWEFTGDILVLHHPTTMQSKYQAVVHIGAVRQTATILNMSHECLRTGDKACVKFRFIKNPEFLHVGTKFVFREGRTKAVGQVTQILYDAPAPDVGKGGAAPGQHKGERRKHKQRQQLNNAAGPSIPMTNPPPQNSETAPT